MPSVQRGQVYKRHGTWHARLYDAEGKRRDKGGFDTKTAAGDWLGAKLEEVAALRGGSPRFGSLSGRRRSTRCSTCSSRSMGAPSTRPRNGT